MTPPRPLHFSVFLSPNGSHESAWRLADGDVRGVLGPGYYAEIARIAERGLMDAVFLADNIAVPEYRVTHLPQTQFDPVVVLAALAAVTSRVGLIGTGSTTYSQPGDLARRFATLDRMSGGRAAWNIVTTSTPLVATNFGQDRHPRKADRYERAHEFVDAVLRAWDGWADDALAGGPEQGRPVLVQAGQSAGGISLAARYAELVFSAQPTLADAARFRSELRQRAAAAGRGPGLPLVLPALTITLGGTETEARERAAELEALASPELRWQNLLYAAGHDPDGFDPDAPLPPELYDGRPLPAGRARRLYEAARDHPGLPLRELARLMPKSGPPQFTGTPGQLAEHVITWQDAGAADGFTIMCATLPRELAAFADEVVPVLQAGGRYRTGYSGRTLRAHLGLDRPGLVSSQWR
jgi:alkanesulfonate monooxygenase SsuD/methylene tetrahydromethanopterin reductase-like flavin-dependent oxidoreductase (luciferase family)